MELGGELLGTELESGHHLFGQNATVQETEGVKTNLTNNGVVGHHHSDGSEKSLQVVGQFSTTSITGVHSNENAESRLHLDEGAFEEHLRV